MINFGTLFLHGCKLKELLLLRQQKKHQFKNTDSRCNTVENKDEQRYIAYSIGMCCLLPGTVAQQLIIKNEKCAAVTKFERKTYFLDPPTPHFGRIDVVSKTKDVVYLFLPNRENPLYKA